MGNINYNMKSKCPHKLSLTSIKVFSDKYTEFQHHNLVGGISLQKLVNRSIHLYITDQQYREKLNECADLYISGSAF